MRTHFGLRSGFVELPRRWHRRLVWHVFIVDMEPWRKQDCPHCGERFTEDPRLTCSGESMHPDCSFVPDHRHSWGMH